MDWLKMLAIAGMNGGGSGGSGGGVSPEEVTTIVKEQFPGGVGYSEENAVLFPEQELTANNGQIAAACDFAFVEGRTYKVTFNGDEYVCTPLKFQNMLAIGDLPAMYGQPGTGEPFVMAINNGSLNVMLLNGDTSATVKITGAVHHTVDEKYMPKTVPLMVNGQVPAPQVEPHIFYVTFSNHGSDEYTCDVTKDDIVAAYYAKKLVVGRVETSGGYYMLLLQSAGALWLSFSGYVCDYLADGTAGHNMVVQYDGTTVKVIKS